MKILVTGCNGYIGSHTVKKLAEAGHYVSGLDWATPFDQDAHSDNDPMKYLETFTCADISFPMYVPGHFDACIHLAALISVGDSVKYPTDYYRINTYGTHNVIAYLEYDKMIFGSTAAAFDMVSPYGRSKVAAEDIIRELEDEWTIFRFFNVAGSDGEFRQGGPATHLIRIAAETAAGKRPKMTINGNDFDTPDGTCYRDYVHVEDLADCIVKSVDIKSDLDYECISTGKVFSNLEVVETMRRVTGVNFDYDFGPRRAGDPGYLASPEVTKYMTDTPRSLEEMCLSAYKMELKNV